MEKPYLAGMRQNNYTRYRCERLFAEGGPFYHLFTSALKEDLLFRNEEEMDLALNLISLAVYETDVSLLAFAVMNNHLHFVLEAPENRCLVFYSNFQQRLAKIYSRQRRAAQVWAVEPSLTPINDLTQLRDEIAYVIRNPFVATDSVNLFSYRWCSGYLYFNGMRDLQRQGIPASELTQKERRAFKHERDDQMNPRIRVLNGVALPSSFTDYERTMSFFDSSRQFIHWVLKNVESQVAIAKRMGEPIMLNDTELWSVVFRLCRDTYHADSPKELSNESRVKLIRALKFDYNASNPQIARCTGLSPAAIDQMFPLSAR